MKFGHKSLAFFSGALWLMAGISLLSLGLNLTVETLLLENAGRSYPLINLLSSFVGGAEPAVIAWMALALLVGQLKGRKVLSKTAHRTLAHLETLPEPAAFSALFPLRYLALIGVMVLFGALLRMAPQDVRGVVDIAVGSALIQGSMVFFRAKLKVRTA